MNVICMERLMREKVKVVGVLFLEIDGEVEVDYEMMRLWLILVNVKFDIGISLVWRLYKICF